MEHPVELSGDFQLRHLTDLPTRISVIVLDYIKKNNLMPGDKLPSENSLSKALGVSSRSIREALKILQARGLVEIKHGKGTYLVNNAYNSFLDTLATTLHFSSDVEALILKLIQVRMIIEPAIIKIVASQRTEKELQTLRNILSSMEKATEAQDREKFIYYDIRFHKTIFDIAGNDILIALYNVLWEVILESLKKTDFRVFTEEDAKKSHHEIFDAIKDKDGERAAQILTEQLSANEDAIKRQISNSDS